MITVEIYWGHDKIIIDDITLDDINTENGLEYTTRDWQRMGTIEKQILVQNTAFQMLDIYMTHDGISYE